MKEESELFEELEDIVLARDGRNGTANNTENSLIQGIGTVVGTVGAVGGATVLAAAAAAPPPLPMMAPQGLPQPGSVSAGGGVLPATAFAVS